MSESFDLIIKNGLCFIEGKLKKVDIGIKDSLIKEIKELPAFKTSQVVDAKNLLVLPGAIDTQVHFREPGATDSEDLYSGSRAAIMGGITSIFEMPNTNPSTSSKKEFLKKINLANKIGRASCRERV